MRRASLPKRIFVQSDVGHGYGNSTEGLAVRHWALMENIPVQSFRAEELLGAVLPLTADSLVVGSVECISAALRQLGAAIPEANYYPNVLGHQSFIHRQIAKVPIESFDFMVKDLPRYFVKSQGWKVIEGQVVEGAEARKAMSERVLNSGENYVWMSLCVDFVAEWRVYQTEGDIVGVARYDDGEDDGLELDMSLVEKGMNALAKYLPAAAHVADWGLTKEGKTALIEVGDAWAVGCYGGMDRVKYGDMLWCRWQEMVKVKR